MILTPKAVASSPEAAGFGVNTDQIIAGPKSAGAPLARPREHTGLEIDQVRGGASQFKHFHAPVDPLDVLTDRLNDSVTTTPGAQLNDRIDDLRETIESLKSEIADLKAQLKTAIAGKNPLAAMALTQQLESKQSELARKQEELSTLNRLQSVLGF